MNSLEKFFVVCVNGDAYILVATFCTAKELQLFMWGGLATHYLIRDL